MNNFTKLNLKPELLKAVEDLQYPNPTAIQKKIIPLALKGFDLIGGSKSGTGKTAAFVLPTLQKILKIIKPEHRVPRVLIIAPTSELVSQISHAIDVYSKYIDVKNTQILGGVPKPKQIDVLEKGVDIIVATPGRLIDLHKDKHVDLSSVNTIILDEADSMLEDGFLDQITYLMARCSSQRQIMMFSATISQNVKKLAKEFMYEPLSIEVSQRRDVVDAINHISYKVDKKRKTELLAKILKSKGNDQALVFVGSKEEANEVNTYLFTKSIRAVTVHSDIKKNDRLKAFTIFRNKKVQVLVTTDISARGIDIKELPLVVNYSLPENTDEFTHRSGRTARAGRTGHVITLLTTFDYAKFSKMEIHLKLSIKRDIYKGFELEDRQPRQRQPKKKSLREKKGYVDYKKNNRNRAMLERQRHEKSRDKSRENKKK